MTGTVIIATSRPLPLPDMEVGGRTLHFVHAPDKAAIPADAQVFLSTAIDPVDAALIAAMPDGLGLIANLGVGFDNIDRAAAARRGLQVSNTPVVTEDTADLAFALILAACRQLGASERYLRGGSWQAGIVPPPIGMRVSGAVLGLVGFGEIGQAVARRAAGFGMTILYHTRNERPEGAALGAQYRADLKTLLAEADIVSLHTPLSDTTRGLIDAEALAACRQGAVLVNTARGAVVDEQALIAALQSGHIAAAGLDVFTGEPTVPAALTALENVVLTPHIGGGTVQCRRDVVQRGIANIAAFLTTGTVLDPVPLA